MAKEDNTLTCIVLIIGIILFVMYINNQKVIEGHTNSPNMTLDDLILDASHLSSLEDPARYTAEASTAVRSCILQCFNREGVSPSDRQQLFNEVQALQQLSQATRYSVTASDTTSQAVIQTLNRIRRLEESFRKGGVDSTDTSGAPNTDNPPGLCTNIVDGTIRGMGEGTCSTNDASHNTEKLCIDANGTWNAIGPTRQQCWGRSRNQFELLKNIRTLFHVNTPAAELSAASGTCSDTTKLTESECTGEGGTWTANQYASELIPGQTGIPSDYEPTNSTPLPVNLNAAKQNYEKYNLGIAGDGTTYLWASAGERDLPDGWNTPAPVAVTTGDQGDRVLQGEPRPRCNHECQTAAGNFVDTNAR